MGILQELAKLKIVFRSLRLMRINNNLWVFLIFLGVSAVFWVLQTLNEDSNANIHFKLNITDVPPNVILTGDIPDDMRVVVKGHGWSILQQIIDNEELTAEVSFNDISNDNGTISIEPVMFHRALSKKLPTTLEFVSTSPNRLTLYYSSGERKRVPVNKSIGRIVPANSRVHCGTIITPDSVDIYAPEQLLMEVSSVSIVKQNLVDVEDTLKLRVPLELPNGVKAVPDSIDVTICIDLFTDKTIPVPILYANTPENTLVRTFPQQIQVTSHVSSAHYGNLSANDFLIVVDYDSLNYSTGKVKAQLLQSPKDVRNVRLSPEYVEFVIETAE